MEIVNFVPNRVKRETLSWEPHLLVPTGDWQFGADGFWQKGFEEYLGECVEEAAGSPILALGVGDYADLMSPSNRVKLVNAALYDRPLEALEIEANRDIKGILEMVGNLGPNWHWVGLLEGHHYFVFDDGTTTDTRLAKALNTEFLGDCAIVQFHFKKNAHISKIVNVWCHHGRGTASPMNALGKIAAEMENIDLFIMGHTPHLETKRQARVFPTAAGRLKDRDVRLVGTGGWLRGYTVGSKRDGRAQGNYVEQGMMAAVPLGGVKVWMRPWTKGSDIGVKLEVIV